MFDFCSLDFSHLVKGPHHQLASGPPTNLNTALKESNDIKIGFYKNSITM